MDCCLQFTPTAYDGAFASCVDIAGHHISGLGIALIIVAGEHARSCPAMQLRSSRLPCPSSAGTVLPLEAADTNPMLPAVLIVLVILSLIICCCCCSCCR